jgi:hypothetical protein
LAFTLNIKSSFWISKYSNKNIGIQSQILNILGYRHSTKHNDKPPNINIETESYILFIRQTFFTIWRAPNIFLEVCRPSNSFLRPPLTPDTSTSRCFDFFFYTTTGYK